MKMQSKTDWMQATLRLREDIAQGMSDVQNGRVKEIDFDRLKQQGAAILQRERLMRSSLLVREESMRVNAEFDAFEGEPLA
jgi:hypothetical protein